MNKLELYVDNQRVELFKDEEITITQSIKKLQDIETVFTDYTQDFSVPASKENSKIFRHLHRGDVANSLDVRKRTNADILLNGMLFKRGYIVFREAQVNNGKVVSYKLYFVGGLGHLKQKLGDVKINQLDYNIAATQDFDSVREGLQRNRTELKADGTLEDILYSLITTDEGYYYSDDVNNPGTSQFPKNLSIAGFNNVFVGGGGVTFQSLKPSIRMNSIVKAIESRFRNQGVRFSTDFFNSDIATNPEWMNLFMLMHNKKGNIEGTELTSLKKITTGSNPFAKSQVNWQTSVAEVSILGNYQSSQVFNTDTNTWDVTVSGVTLDGVSLSESRQKIKYIDLLAFTTNPNANYSIYMKEVSNPEAEFQEIIKDSSGFQEVRIPFNTDDTEEFGDQRIYSFYVETDLAVQIYLDVAAVYKGVTVFSGDDFDVANLSSAVGTEQTIDIPKLMPDIKVLDFLKGVFKLFNLIAYEDRDGTIVVEQYDKWREDKKTVDITEYVNDSKYGIDLKIPYNAVNLRYRENEYTERRFRNKPLQETSTNEYGSLSITDSNITSSDKSYTSEIPFELMRYQRLFHSTDETASDLDFDLLTSIQIGELVDDSGDELKGKGIIYYPINSLDVLATNEGFYNSVALNNGEGTIYSQSRYNIPSNTMEVRTESNPEPFALPFGDYKDSWTDDNVTDAGMYNNNHFDFISPIFNVRNKALKLELYLPSHLLTELELRDDIIFKNKMYRINSLKTNLQSGKSSIEIVGYSTTGFSKIIKGINANAPVITLNGASEVNVSYGATYTDLGATATDAEDGSVTVTDDSADIDTTNTGNQTVTYNAVDSDGNSAAAVFRTVIVGAAAAPTVEEWSLVSTNQSTNVFEIDYEVESVDVELGRLKFFVKLQGAADSPFDQVTSVNGAGNNTLSGTFTHTGSDTTVYEAYMTITAGGQTTRSGDVTITLI